MKTTGNTILITGAGTGMGLEAARQFDRAGNTVIMVARNGTRLRAEAAALTNAVAYPLDITDSTEIDQLIDYLRQEHPELNMVFLNAGVTNSYELFAAEDAYKYAAQEVETNYLSTVRLTQALEPLISPHPEAAFVVTTSAVAYAPDMLNPTYSATKAALHSFVQAARLVLQRRESSVQVFELVAPLVDAPFSAHVISDQKMPPEQVINALITGLENNELEMRVGLSETVYQDLRISAEKALQTVNGITGG